MPFKKGKSGNAKGRKKGVPNKATAEARTNFSILLTNNIDKMQGWLDAVAVDDPLAALRVVTDWAEFSIPKLARTEISGPSGDNDGGPIHIIYKLRADVGNRA